MSDNAVVVPAPVLVPVPAPAPVTADKGTAVVTDLMSPTTVRADIVAILGVIGVVAGAFGKNLHIPPISDATLIGVSGLVVLGVQVVRNMVHGAVTKAALQNDAVFLKDALPQVQADVAVLKPIAAQVTGIQSAVDEATTTAHDASTTAAEAKDLAGGLQAQIDGLPVAQRDQIESVIRALLAGVSTPPSVVVEPGPVAITVAPAPTS